jgi:hypothetical protein
MASPTTKAKVDAQSLTVANLLKEFYEVPDFQRGYVWGKKQVLQFIRDLHDGWSENAAVSYFIGSIVTYPTDDQRRAIVDGQQRLTTLVILMAAMRHEMLSRDPASPVVTYTNALAAVHTSEDGTETEQVRLRLTAGSTAKVLDQIIAADPTLKESGPATPEKRMVGAYLAARRFLADELPVLDDLRKFGGYLLNTVYAVHIESHDFVSALTIFETINDRGVSLSVMDLLKNLMFKETDEKQHPELNQRWSQMVEHLQDEGETNPVRFLRYYLVSQYTFKKMPQVRELFDWIKKNADLLSYRTDALTFVNRLYTGSTHYANLLNARTIHGDESPALHRLTLQRTSAKQHIMLLLAGSKLSDEDFELLAQAVERLVFVFAVTRTPWNRIEQDSPAWCTSLRSVRTRGELTAFLAATIEGEIAAVSPLFFEGLRNPYKLTAGLRRYALVSLANELEKAAGKGDCFDWLFKQEIEHIAPQSQPDETVFPPELVNEIGNLTLLEKVPNIVAGDKIWEEKHPYYHGSPVAMSRALVGNLAVGKNTKFTKAAALLPEHQEWTPAEIGIRSDRMLQLASHVWGVPYALPSEE